MIDNYLDIVGTIKEENGKLVVSSRIIAEKLGKRHSDVLESIDNIIKTKSITKISVLFISSNYIASNGKRNREYLLTKNGFILYMFNIQGYIEFKMAYINEYDRMESFIKGNYEIEYKKYAKREITKLNNSLQTQIKEIENKLENQIRIDYSQQRAIQKKINHKIEIKYYDFILASSKSKRSWYMALYKGIKDKFQVASYRDLKQKDFENCVEFINNWTPPKYLFEE